MSARFDIRPTPLAGLMVVERKPAGDQRGYLERMFCLDDFATILNGSSIAQINHSLTRVRGTIRGMHFQHPPAQEMKFVSCLRGEVFDVAVDVRPGSPTRYHWHAEILSEGNHKTLAIPAGYAHGFQTLTDNCEMLYFHTAAYQPAAEDGLNPKDPALAIVWPLAVAGLSPRDAAHPLLKP